MLEIEEEMGESRICTFCGKEAEYVWQGYFHCYSCLGDQLIEEALFRDEVEVLDDE